MNAVISKESVAAAVEAAIRHCATHLRPDVREALQRAADEAALESRGQRVLQTLCENAAVAEADGVPLCQDTGTVWVCLEVGRQLCVPGDVFDLVDTAVAKAYGEGKLRMSVLKDALFDRTNTTDNTENTNTKNAKNAKNCK